MKRNYIKPFITIESIYVDRICQMYVGSGNPNDEAEAPPRYIEDDIEGKYGYRSTSSVRKNIHDAKWGSLW